MNDFRSSSLTFLRGLMAVEEENLQSFARDGMTPDTVWDVAYPIEQLVGPEAVLEGFVLPLRRAIRHPRRRDEIFIGGANQRAQGGDWIAAVTHYVGNFTAPFVGISPSDRLAFLRSGEFYRIDNGLIAKARIIVDLPDLMRQTGRFPLPRMMGTEIQFPGPATHDGVLPANREDGAVSLGLVRAMLADLHAFDPDSFGSDAQTGAAGYWDADMLWYGPGGVGSNYRWGGFVKDHRAGFLTAFPDRKGGDHYCHIGDGNYAAVSGWPSMTMTHRGDYLGVPATNRQLTLRVMDFYRCATGKIAENWVLLDYVDLFRQMDVDLIARSEALV
ncbi:MAG: ester cyclase [Alphaproteobacteria bacterium]